MKKESYTSVESEKANVIQKSDIRKEALLEEPIFEDFVLVEEELNFD